MRQTVFPRVRSDFHRLPYEITFNPTPEEQAHGAKIQTFGSDVFWPEMTFSHADWMLDGLHPWKLDPKLNVWHREPGDCVHYSNSLVFSNGLQPWVIPSGMFVPRKVGLGSDQIHGAPTVFSLDPHDMRVGLFPVPPLSVSQDLRLAAAISFKTQIPKQIDGLAFGAELPDTLSLIPDPRQLKNLRDRSQLCIDGMVKAIADGHLTWSFAIKPLLSDVRTLVNLYGVMLRRLQWLRKVYGKVVRLSFRKKNVWAPSRSSDGSYGQIWSDPYADRGNRFCARITKFRLDFTATSALTHRLRGLNSWMTENFALAAALGLNSPLASAWELTKLSFVLDWLLRIGDRIDYLTTVQPFLGMWHLFGTTHSWKWNVEYEAYQCFQLQHGNQPVLLGKGTAKRYERYVGLPVEAGLSLSDLTPSQMALFASLVTQRHQ